jgi:hypothetical protein
MTWEINSNGMIEKIQLIFPEFMASSRPVDEEQSRQVLHVRDSCCLFGSL